MDAIRDTDTTEKMVETPEQPKAKKHVLIVEDYDFYSDFLRENLSQEYNVEIADNLKDARVKAQKMRLNGGLDLVITDLYFPTFPNFKEDKYESKKFYNMPEKNGNNFAKFIRKFYPNTPIIGLSQKSQEFEQEYFNRTYNKQEIGENIKTLDLTFNGDYAA
ncbi:MAG: response regulator [Nanoarchaeota archaeon]|nr:response regulator [Nanoarchaeota archaeon]